MISHKKENGWKPINTARHRFLREVDLWLKINPSLRSMGMSDSFRVPNAYWMDEQPEEYREESGLRDDWHEGWFHLSGGKHRRLDDRCITHWMPIPKEPR